MTTKKTKKKVEPGMEELLLKAARRMLSTQSDLDTALAKLEEERKAWSKKVRAANREFETSLKEATIDPGDPKRDVIKSILGAMQERDTAHDKKVQCADKESAAMTRLQTEIEAGPPGASVVLKRIAKAHEELKESIAGKKQALHMLLLDIEELNAKSRKQIEGARQLSLFD